MATKSRVQRYFDIIRGKRGWGAIVNLDVVPTHYGSQYIYEAHEAQPFIKRLIESGRPGFLARPGRTELKVVAEFLNQLHKDRVEFSEKWRRTVAVGAGFFTPTHQMLARFAGETLRMFRDADIFAAYGAVRGERIICRDYLPADAIVCNIGALFCHRLDNPWTESLRGKKVLVLHPFAETIETQYKKRELLFPNSNVLPEFELTTIKAVQTSANNPTEFPDWFAALDHMKAQIDRTDFDVALIGAGAYGFFLAHHCKAIGKVGIQVASFGQLLFGITGQRWIETNALAGIANEHWVRPPAEDRPAQADLVEHACYW